MPGVYISYPFCAQKCTYCNFASGVFSRELENAYLQSLREEILETTWLENPDTLYLGGGTPSLLDAEQLASILTALPSANWTEATMEAAPGGLDADKIASWVKLGINRVSLGTQSFVTSELRRTGRRHDAKVVEEEVARLQQYGISNINLDLIAGLPGQNAESWEVSLDWVERLGSPHVSVYMLEVDDDSRLGAEVIAFGKRYGAADIPSEEQIADLYQRAVERLAAMGIHRYEISNFARPGFESRHNLKYWRRDPYLGFGSDAHSFDGDSRWANPETPQEYVRERRREPHSCDPASETLMLGLRLTEGVDTDWSRYREAIERRIAEGLLLREGNRLKLTSRGVLLSNTVFADFV